jgi:serine/threonine protein kinase/Ran GTPase-activating protein (RanGAP) involved in mRNA processing and transport
MVEFSVTMSDGTQWVGTDTAHVARLLARKDGVVPLTIRASDDEQPELSLEIADIVPTLGGNRTLTSLTLHECRMGDDGAKALAVALSRNATLTTLSLTRNQICDEGMKAIASVLAGNTAIATLCIRGELLGVEGATALATAVARNTSLRSLELENIEVGDQLAIAMAKALVANSTLSRLLMSACEVGDEGAAALFGALARSSALTMLRLPGNNIGDEGATAIGEALGNPTRLMALDLGNNVMRSVGVGSIAAGLEFNFSLNTLGLEHVECGDAGAVELAQMLCINTTLQNLYLDATGITDRGATAMADAVASNTTLKVLNMSYNEIGATGVSAMATALTSNSTLTTLSLAYGEFDGPGAQGMALAIAENSTVTTFALHGPMDADGTKVLIDALVRNTTITEFSISLDQAGEDAPQLISAILKRNKDLTALRAGRLGDVPDSLPDTCSSLSDLRVQCASDNFYSMGWYEDWEETLVAAAALRDPLRRSAGTVDQVFSDWRSVIAAQNKVARAKRPTKKAIDSRDTAVSKFTISSRTLDGVQATLTKLLFVLDDSCEMDGSERVMPVAEVDGVLAKVLEWSKRVDEVTDVWKAQLCDARDAFVEAHDDLGVAIGSGKAELMLQVEDLCLLRAWKVATLRDVGDRRPPFPLPDMSDQFSKNVISTLRSQGRTILREILSLQQHRRELLSYGELCPTVDELAPLREQLRAASSRAGVLEREYQRSVEDGKLVVNCASALDAALAKERAAARAADAEWLKLSVASTRWPELGARLGNDDDANLRSLAVFDDQRIVADGPPESRCRIVRATAPGGKHVVLKMIPLGDASDGEAKSRFLREAQRLRCLEFKQIVGVRDVLLHVEGAKVFGVLELPYCGHGDMTQRFERESRSLGIPLTKSILADVLLGLAFCHRLEIVHGNLHPANIFIDDDGSAVLGAFDVSQADEVRLTSPVVTGAMAPYVAPELRAPGGGRASKASDMFAYGKVAEYAWSHVGDGGFCEHDHLHEQCLLSDPEKRGDAWEMVFSQVSDHVPVRRKKWKDADCVVCWCPPYDRQRYHCSAGHSLCPRHLSCYVPYEGELDRETRCPDQTCGAPHFDPAQIIYTSCRRIAPAWMRSRVKRTAAVLSSDMEVQRKEQLKARLAEYSTAEGEVKRHTDAIVDRFIDMVCPRCGTAIVHISGSTTVTCDVETCEAQCCVWCLVDCGDEGDDHVLECPSKPEGAKVYRQRHGEHNNVFRISFDTWKSAMDNRTEGLIKEYLEEQIDDASIRTQVEERLSLVVGRPPPPKRGKRRRDV